MKTEANKNFRVKTVKAGWETKSSQLCTRQPNYHWEERWISWPESAVLVAPGCWFSYCNKVNMGSKKVSAYFKKKKKDLGLPCSKALTKNHYNYFCSSENKREFSIIIETPARSEGTKPANDSQSQGQVRMKARGSSHSCVGSAWSPPGGPVEHASSVCILHWLSHDSPGN